VAGTARRAARPLEVWTRPLEGKRTAVALFNRGATPATIEASFASSGSPDEPPRSTSGHSVRSTCWRERFRRTSSHTGSCSWCSCRPKDDEPSSARRPKIRLGASFYFQLRLRAGALGAVAPAARASRDRSSTRAVTTAGGCRVSPPQRPRDDTRRRDQFIGRNGAIDDVSESARERRLVRRALATRRSRAFTAFASPTSRPQRYISIRSTSRRRQ